MRPGKYLAASAALVVAVAAYAGNPDGKFAVQLLSTSGSSKAETVLVLPSASGVTVTGTLASGQDIIGGSNADTLNGSSGPDEIDGAGGADTMVGGSGDDTYYVDNSGDVVTEASGGGTDSVYVTGLSYTVPANVEYVTLSVGSTSGLTLTGTSGDEILVLTDASVGGSITAGAGNDSLYGTPYADTLQGYAGNDMITSAGGNDQIYGHGGDDTVVLMLGGFSSNFPTSMYINLGADTDVVEVNFGGVSATGYSLDTQGSSSDGSCLLKFNSQYFLPEVQTVPPTYDDHVITLVGVETVRVINGGPTDYGC